VRQEREELHGGACQCQPFLAHTSNFQEILASQGHLCCIVDLVFTHLERIKSGNLDVRGLCNICGVFPH